MDAVVKVDGLVISSGTQVLVEEVSFEVHAGERVALLGASGAGKSLTAAALLGTLDPRLNRSGSIMLAGREVSLLPPQKRHGLSAVFQATATALNPLVRVGRQLSLTGGGRTEASELLIALGFTDPERILDSYPGELSGGQRQRVCLGIALRQEPALLVADEPTSALDALSQADVICALTATLPPESALLLITHDIALASQVCQRALVMHDGSLVFDGAFAELLTQQAHPYLHALIEAARQAEAA